MAMNVLTVIVSVAAFVAAAVSMEFVAKFMHKYVMHGSGWCLHYDHHNTSGHRLQRNDLYFFFFAGLSFLLIFNGLRLSWYPMASAGFGVGLYGIGYVVFHDIMYHGRIKALKFKPKHPYLRRILNAHRVHHATVTKDGALSYHFLWAPKKYDPRNQPEVDRQLDEIRKMQMELKRREKEQEKVERENSET